MLTRYVLTTKGNDSLQSSRIHIEIASIISNDNQPRILSYPPLNPAIQVETTSEILADKLTTIDCRNYVKERDLWDIYFLTQEQKVHINWKLVSKKMNDYGFSKQEYFDQLQKRRTELKSSGVSLLTFELKRFLPRPVFSQYEKQFSTIIKEVIFMLPSENDL